jgi:DNA mismatch endonuclease (patch repair protein)
MRARNAPLPSFDGLVPASEASSRCKRMNRNSGTRHECLLRSVLWRRGYRFRKNDKSLIGRPDVVFRKERVAVFCDGDFWHGRRWKQLSRKLRTGTNASYWVNKIQANMLRDRRNARVLGRANWHVVRLWETDILNDPVACAAIVEATLSRRRLEQVTVSGAA